MHHEQSHGGAADGSADEGRKPMVLELRRVSFRGRSENEVQLRRAELQLCAGDVAVVHIDGATMTRELVSMLQGLTMPTEGEVRFCSQDWLGDDHARHFKMRGQIGRVFEGKAWIENLNVDENVTLACRHHGIKAAQIRADLGHWIARFGLEGLSSQRPAFLAPSVLQIHQWIRAFVGSPAMVVLERPLRYLSASWRTKLLAAIEQLRSRGTTVLWFTSIPATELSAGTESLIWWHLVDGQFRKLERGSES